MPFWAGIVIAINVFIAFVLIFSLNLRFMDLTERVKTLEHRLEMTDKTIRNLRRN